MTTVPCWARVRGPLAPYAEGFRVELERLGYTTLTAATHVRLLAHLSRWLAREGVDGSGLTPAVVDAYFAERRAADFRTPFPPAVTSSREGCAKVVLRPCGSHLSNRRRARAQRDRR